MQRTISTGGRQLGSLSAGSAYLSPAALQWCQLPIFERRTSFQSRYLATAAAARLRRPQRTRSVQTDRQQQQPQQETDEQLAAREGLREHETTKLAEHISRTRAHKRQFAPLRSFIHSSPADFILPLAFRHKVDTIAQQQQWNGRLANHYQTSQPELWDAIVRSSPQLAALHRVLTELHVRLPWLEARRVLDVGFGSGVGPWAVREVWGFDGVAEYVAVESNSRMQQLGRAMTDNIEWRISHMQRLSKPLLDELSGNSASGQRRPARGAMDVVVSAYGLSRAGKDQRREQLDVMWRSVARGGVLVIVEDGTEEGFEVVRAAREYLLQRYTVKSKESAAPRSEISVLDGQSTAANASHTSHAFLFSLPSPPSAAVAVTASTPVVVAPCGHDASCPQGKQGVCSFGRRILTASLPHSSPYRALKSDGELGGLLIDRFSYVLLHKGPITPPAAATANAAFEAVDEQEEAAIEYDADQVDLTVSGEQVANEGELENGEQQQEEMADDVADTTGFNESLPGADSAPFTLPLPAAFYNSRYHRVMSPPLLRSKHVTIDLCTTDARLQRWTIPKSAGLEGGYTQARDTKWGDLWNRPKAVSSTSRRKEERRKRDKKAAGTTIEVEQVEQLEVEKKSGRRSRHAPSGGSTREAGSEAATSFLELGQPVHDVLIAMRQGELDERRKKRKKRQQNTARITGDRAAGSDMEDSTTRENSDAKGPAQQQNRRESRSSDEEEEDVDVEVAGESKEDEQAMDEEDGVHDDADEEEDEEEPDRNTAPVHARRVPSRSR